MAKSTLVGTYNAMRLHLIKNLLLGQPMPRTTAIVELLRAEIEARDLKVPES